MASPNDGTPLATPGRWESTVGWFANLMEVFPDNPFTTGAEWVSQCLVWLASHLSGDLPGLRAMDGAGELVSDLQSPPGPPPSAYSALVSNYHPEEALWLYTLFHRVVMWCSLTRRGDTSDGPACLLRDLGEMSR